MPVVELSDGKRFDAEATVSILEAARVAGLVLEHSCRTGRCGLCKATVLGGTTCAVGAEGTLTDDDRRAGRILTCARAATSDVRLDITDLGLPSDIVQKLLPCRIAALEPLNPAVLRVRLKLPPTALFRYLPGQYIDVIAPGGLRRSYSIASAPTTDGGLELHVGRVDGGEMSDFWFDRARVGDLLRFEGPLGTFFHRDRAGAVILLATSTGFAPIKAIVEGFLARPPAGPVLLLWGVATAAGHYHSVDFPGVEYVPVLSRETRIGYARGYVQDVLFSRGVDLRTATVYAAGGPAMIDAARERLIEAGLPSDAFFADAFVRSSPAEEGPS